MALFFILTISLVASVLSLLVRKKTGVLSTIALAASFLELVASFAVVANVVRFGTYSPIPSFSVDSFGAILLMTVAVIGFIACWYSAGYLKVEVAKGIIGFHRKREYFVLLHLFLFAMFFAILTTNPILMWIAIEATTLSTAFLISFYNKSSTLEAAWKYLIINSVGLLLAFFGTLLFLHPSLEAGNHGLISWSSMLANATGFDPFLAKIAFVFVLIGYGTKMGLVPMHTWRPDAYSKAPMPIVALFSGPLLNIAFMAIIKFKLIVDLSIGKDFSQHLLIFFGVISIVVAAFNILGQKSYKRLLAYSSIEHAGIMALGFGFGGIGIFAAILHMIYHCLAKSILFLSAGNFFLKYSSTKIYNIKGALTAIPTTSVMFLIGFLAITGIPPFGLFATEFSILSAGIHEHLTIVVIVLISLAIVFVGFLKDVASMLFGEKEKDLSSGESGAWTIVPIVVLILILIGTSVFVPDFITSLINNAVLVY